MKVWKKLQFDAAHRLMGHEKCGRLHGHTWTVEVEIDGPIDAETGMVLDFGEIKKRIMEKFDHKTILCEDDPLIEPIKEIVGMESLMVMNNKPTSENIAYEIAKALRVKGSVKVTVYETPTARAELEVMML